MNRAISLPKNHFYTDEHEWIDYNGSVAYVGICDFKLSGLTDILQVQNGEMSSLLLKGEVLATIVSGKVKIKVLMPVDGRVLLYNDKLQANPNLLTTDAQKSGWIAKISPSAPYARKGLLKPEEYYQKYKKQFKI